MSKLKQDTPLDVTDTGEAEAIVGVHAMRDRLARQSPEFKAAVDLEREAEDFCREIRDDLRQQRRLKGLDQGAVATRLDMGQSAVSKIETADGDIGIKTIFRYARALGLHPVCVFVPAAEQIFEVCDLDQSGNVARAAAVMACNPVVAAGAFQKAELGLIRDMCKSVSVAMRGAMAGIVRGID
jgi:transcriptional regulator with XRE-family HTH domain